LLAAGNVEAAGKIGVAKRGRRTTVLEGVETPTTTTEAEVQDSTKQRIVRGAHRQHRVEAVIAVDTEGKTEAVEGAAPHSVAIPTNPRRKARRNPEHQNFRWPPLIRIRHNEVVAAAATTMPTIATPTVVAVVVGKSRRRSQFAGGASCQKPQSPAVKSFLKLSSQASRRVAGVAVDEVRGQIDHKSAPGGC
jgi:hypothetical protein